MLSKRIHLFELEDQTWFPDVIRKGITDYLQFAATRFDLYASIIPVIKKGLNSTDNHTIIDIASGGGGGIPEISKRLKNEGIHHNVILTDYYPNINAFEQLSKDNANISFNKDSIDATNVPSELKGFRTLFVAFHHFQPVMAKKILDDAVKSQSPIGIFEVTERTFSQFIAMLFSPLAVMIAVPFIKPFSWKRLLFTYLIPLIPFATMWDGIVSVLRSYSPDELNNLIGTIDQKNYEWEIGKVKSTGPLFITYLLGLPKKE